MRPSDHADSKFLPQDLPELIAPKTYNTAHPYFRSWKTHNYPGKLYTGGTAERWLFDFPHIGTRLYREKLVHTKIRYFELGFLYWLDRILPLSALDSHNKVFRTLRSWARLGYVPASRLDENLACCATEVGKITASAEFFDKHSWMEHWLERMNREKPGTYFPGWVPLRDAYFLYWLVRELQPEICVQTGVSNGVSAAFIVMALHQNGKGKLHAIDRPYIYDPHDPSLNEANLYGVIVPEGKESGWLVPDEIRDRFEVHIGLSEDLLPSLVAGLDKIDFFFHDSDHRYDHMMFEFNTVLPRMNPGGLMVADDVSWTTAVWDFARQTGVPGFNYRGSIGTMFL